MNIMKKSKKELNREEARELRHNKGLTIEEFRKIFNQSRKEDMELEP